MYLIDVDMNGVVTLRPCWAWDVQGNDYRPETWRYRVDVAAPDGHRTLVVGADQVLHLRLVTSAASPWAGVPAWRAAKLTADMAGAIDQRLGEEAAASSGYLIPVADVGDATDGAGDVQQLQADMKAAKGSTLLTPTHAAGLGDGPGAAPPPTRELRPTRYGVDPPSALVTLRSKTYNEMLSLYGIPPALADERSAGTALREAWRILVRLTIEPMMRTIAAPGRAGARRSRPAVRHQRRIERRHCHQRPGGEQPGTSRPEY